MSVKIVGRNNRIKILIVVNRHVIVVHRIAQLAFFGYCLLILGGFVCVKSNGIIQMVVRKYHRLPRHEAK